MRALERIMRALKPGGRLVLDEFDCTYTPVLAAPSEASRALFIKGTDAIHGVLTDAGADIAWGRNAFAAMAAAGFVDLESSRPGRKLISTNEFEGFLRLVSSPEFVSVDDHLGRKRL